MTKKCDNQQTALTLNLLKTTIVAPPSNASAKSSEEFMAQ